MIKIKTRSFGEIEIADEKVIVFPRFLPGFIGFTKYTLISDPDEAEPVFYWMQSLEDGDLSFCLTDLSRIIPDYNPLVEESELEWIGGLGEGESYLIYNVAVIPANPKDITVNLKAPIIINPHTRQGVQAICQNEGYAVRHPLIKDKAGD